MKLKEYIDGLNKFIEENPEALEFDVVTSKDDEGNGYNIVYCTPDKGFYDEDVEDFTPTSDYEDCEIESNQTNAVCIN